MEVEAAAAATEFFNQGDFLFGQDNVDQELDEGEVIIFTDYENLAKMEWETGRDRFWKNRTYKHIYDKIYKSKSEAKANITIKHVNSHQDMATNWPAVANNAADIIAKFAAKNSYTKEWGWVNREPGGSTPQGATRKALPSGYLPSKQPQELRGKAERRRDRKFMLEKFRKKYTPPVNECSTEG